LGGRRRKKRLHLAIGVVAVLALAGGGVVWFAGSRDQAPAPGGGAGGVSTAAAERVRSITEQPTLGQAISTTDVMGAGFARSEFVGFMDDDTALISGTDDLYSSFVIDIGELERPDSASGEPAQPLYALVALDLTTAAEKWRVTLADAFGWDPAVRIFANIRASGGLALIQARQDSDYADAAIVLATVNGAGEIVSLQENAQGSEWLSFSDGVALFQGRGKELVAYDPLQLNQPLWRAAGAETSFSLHNSVTGAWWVLAKAGFVDVRTGEELWSTANETLQRGPQGLIVTKANDRDALILRDWKSGAETANHDLGENGSLLSLGETVAYVADDQGTVTGLSLTDGLREL
jgi:hypothetical protein